MASIENININFQQGLNKLGFADDDALFLVNTKSDDLPDIEIVFHLYNAKKFGATAAYLRKQLNGSYKPQVYLFNKTDKSFNDEEENKLSEIQKKIWTSGEAPIACIFYNTSITILDCTTHIRKDYKPEYLIKTLNLIGKADKLYNEHFAVKIKSGVFWEQEELKNKFKFQNSAYDRLIENIKVVEEVLFKELKNTSKEIITKIIVQSILIKYLEERIDNTGNKLLSEKYFQKYDGAATFGDVLNKGKFVELLDGLNNEKTGFNGNVFKWEDSEKEQLKKLPLSIVADLLATDKTSLSSLQQEIKFPDWRYFEFRYIPVELISRLYEEFLGEGKKEKGLYYTPSHLAKLLVDECLPLKKYQDINLEDFTILDPACGSGIFLVVAFKRLVQIWRLQHAMKLPSVENLKSILRNIYGVDKEEQAIQLASFSLSLALCDELEPKKIINELKFDDLRKENLISSDFFTCEQINGKKFDLVIGNPPFIAKSIEGYKYIWQIEKASVKIPQKQLSLNFLSESLKNVKNNALLCLIIKSSSLLYNTSSKEYKKTLFSNYNVVQIFDFTALARNKSLWDNGADVASAAIFVKNQKPDITTNILHLTFRRTKSTKERIVFEIDDYDLHFVNRQTVKENQFIWKNNLLGGGRIKTTIEKLRYVQKLKDLLENNNDVIYGEGSLGAKSLPNKAFSSYQIEKSYLTEKYNSSFQGKKDKRHFEYPNFLIKTNIDLPFCLNRECIKYNEEVVGIHSNNSKLLNDILSYFEGNQNILKFYNICTSGQMLVNLNTACTQENILSLPFDLDRDLSTLLSDIDSNIIHDVNDVMQFFLRNAENSNAVQPIKKTEFVSILNNYGIEFSGALNSVYETDNRKFRLSDVIELKNSLIATVFKYDSSNESVKFLENFSELNIDGLTESKISAQLSVNRIIKLYPQKDTVVFVKPNQYRYWLSLIAYRDADKCFADLSNAGF